MMINFLLFFCVFSSPCGVCSTLPALDSQEELDQVYGQYLHDRQCLPRDQFNQLYQNSDRGNLPGLVAKNRLEGQATISPFTVSPSRLMPPILNNPDIVPNNEKEPYQAIFSSPSPLTFLGARGMSHAIKAGGESKISQSLPMEPLKDFSISSKAGDICLGGSLYLCSLGDLKVSQRVFDNHQSLAFELTGRMNKDSKDLRITFRSSSFTFAKDNPFTIITNCQATVIFSIPTSGVNLIAIPNASTIPVSGGKTKTVYICSFSGPFGYDGYVFPAQFTISAAAEALEIK